MQSGPRQLLIAALLAVVPASFARAGAPGATPAGSAQLPSGGERARVVDVHRLGLHISNTGPFAYDFVNGSGSGLEYPRGSGLPLAFAAGPWLIGIAAADTLTAISEFTWEYSPGPSTAGAARFDTLRNVIYRTACADTAGRAAWLARGAAIGAPLDLDGDPLQRGDLHLWTRFTDAEGPWSSRPPRFGSGPPIGVDVMLSAYAYDRPGALSETVFLEYTLVHRGTTTLDSAWFGIFLDPVVSVVSPPRISWDAERDLAIAYRASDRDELYGAAGPALGLLWLRGPRPSAADPLRPTSFVVHPNGADPANMHDFLGAMRGLRLFGGPMVDPTTNQPSAFWSTGDPVTGAGWVDSTIAHPHVVLAAGPFRFAPGDTQHVALAVLAARGPSRLASVTRLRRNAIDAEDAWARAFEDLALCPPRPAPPATSGRVWPNPAALTADIGWQALPGEPLHLEVLDARGRRVRTWRTVATQGPNGSTRWDLSDDDGHRVPPGLYFVRISGPGFRHTARLVVLD